MNSREKLHMDHPDQVTFRSNNGCWVNRIAIIVFIVVAILVALATGLIGHFATKNAMKCNCPKVTPTPAVTNVPVTKPSSTAATTPKPPTPDEFRLPKNLIPYHYNLRFQPYIYDDDNKTEFDGEVDIFMTCNASTKVITLNARDIKLLNSTLNSLNSKAAPKIIRSEFNERLQFLQFYLDGNMTKNASYSLSLKYKGKLNYIENDKLNGFYRSWYEENGKIRYLATTHFAPDRARKAFPCFDEPAMKSTFNITLVHRKDYTALANMPEYNSNAINRTNWVETSFEKSVKMSTYLVCFVICDYKSINSTSKGGVQIRIWTRKDLINQAKYASTVAGPILDWFENYTMVNFPISKLDHISIPQFAAGAMENWGLITYREEILLYDPKNSPTSGRQRTAVVIAHEIAHQWFGNLVTCAYWEHTWLNEGFATIFGYAGIQWAEPKWPQDELMVNSVRDVYDLDSRVTSQPVQITIRKITDPRRSFKRQTYAKGGSLVRMMEFLLSRETFRKGLKIYFDAHAYDVARADDLWAALSKAANGKIDVKTIMDPWIQQIGYPVVTINRTGVKAVVSQEHFLLDPSQKDKRPPSKFNYKWQVPVSYNYNNESIKYTTKLMLKPNKTETIEIPKSIQWTLGNIQRAGFYRVNYDQSNRQHLVSQLMTNTSRIPMLNRMAFIDDTFALARSGLFNITLPMETTKYLSKEGNHIPWATALDNLDIVDFLLRRYPVFSLFQAYIRKLINPAYQKVVWNFTNNDSHMDKYFRSTILWAACYFEHHHCLQEAFTRFSHYKRTGNNNIHPDQRITVYYVASSKGTPEDWQFLYNRYKNASSPIEKTYLSLSLAWSRTPWLLTKLLQMALDKNEIAVSERTPLFAQIALNDVGRPIVWDYLRENWNTTSLGNDKQYVLQTLVRGFSTKYDLQQLNDFIRDNPGEDFSMAKDIVESNIKWIQDNKDTLEDWLKQQI